jgi:hypothetical protein
MISVNEIKKALTDTEIKLFSTYTDSDDLENKMIEIGDGLIDELIEFLVANNIKTLQYMIKYISIDAFLITEDDVRDLKIPDALQDEIWNEIKEYNEKLEKIDFGRPYSITIYCLHESCFFGINDYDLWFQDEKVQFPSDKLEELLSNYKLRIEEKKKEDKKHLEKLKEEFKKVLLNDAEFLKCSNKKLRDNFVQKAFERPEFEKYIEVFDPRDRQFHTVYAKAYVDLFWSEYRNSKK